MNSFKRLLAYAKPYGRFWPGYLVLSVLSVIFSVVNYALIGPLLTVLFEPADVGSIAQLPAFELTPKYFETLFQYYLSGILASYGVLRALFFVSLILVLTSFLSNLTRYLSQRILVSMRTYIMLNIRRDLFNKIASLNVGYFNVQR